MTAKEWRRRINKAMQSQASGDGEPLAALCRELESLTEPVAESKPEPVPEMKLVPAMELKAVPESEIET